MFIRRNPSLTVETHARQKYSISGVKDPRIILARKYTPAHAINAGLYASLIFLGSGLGQGTEKAKNQ